MDTMVVEEYGRTRKIYDDYKAALAEVKRLNAERKGAGENGTD